MQVRRINSFATMLGSSLLVIGSTPAGAQVAQNSAEGANATQDPNDIVVTALRREQRLQDIPATLSVLDAASLENRGSKDFRDYLSAIPGVIQSEVGYRGSRVIIRGVSDGTGATPPLSGIYIDEAPVTETAQPTFDPSLYDVERVEVLKGPQGTLYGSGSMGGTVRVILKKPVMDEFHSQLEGNIGAVSHGSANYRVDGVVNVPIVTDTLALRLVGSYRKDNGFINDTLRKEEDANYIEKKNVRGALRWTPEPGTTIDLGFLYQKENLGAPNFSELSPGNPPRYTQRKAYPQTGPSNTKLFSLTINHDFGFAGLTSATNYLHKFSAANIDATRSFSGLLGMITGVPIPVTDGFGINTEGRYKVFTQEVRLASQRDGPFEWIIGGFYSRVKDNDRQFADLDFAPSVSSLLTGPSVYDSNADDVSRQIAGFGELTWKITDKLSVTGGLRAFDIRQRSTQTDDGILAGGMTVSQSQAHSSSVTQKYLISYKAANDHLFYAQAAQGFRQGGTNPPVPATLCGADLAELGYTRAPRDYKPDDLWNYEFGSKNTFMDNRATLNAAAYYIRWSKIQTLVGLPTCLQSFTGNAGRAEIKGVDLDGSIRPIDGLNIGAALSYIDAKITQSAPGITPQRDDRLPLVAKWSWSANVRYEFAVNDSMRAFIYGDANQVGRRWNDFRGAGPVSAAKLPSYILANARIGISQDKWSVAVFATNVFNKYYAVNRFMNPAQIYDVIGEPRVVGVNVKVGF